MYLKSTFGGVTVFHDDVEDHPLVCVGFYIHRMAQNLYSQLPYNICLLEFQHQSVELFSLNGAGNTPVAVETEVHNACATLSVHLCHDISYLSAHVPYFHELIVRYKQWRDSTQIK